MPKFTLPHIANDPFAPAPKKKAKKPKKTTAPRSPWGRVNLNPSTARQLKQIGESLNLHPATREQMGLSPERIPMARSMGMTDAELFGPAQRILPGGVGGVPPLAPMLPAVSASPPAEDIMPNVLPRPVLGLPALTPQVGVPQRPAPTYPMYAGSQDWDTAPGWLQRAERPYADLQENALPQPIPTQPQPAPGDAIPEQTFWNVGRQMMVGAHPELARAYPGGPTLAGRGHDYAKSALPGLPHGVPFAGETLPAPRAPWQPSLPVPGGEEALARAEAARQAEALQAQGMAATHAAYSPMAKPLPYAASEDLIPKVPKPTGHMIGTTEGVIPEMEYRLPMPASGRYAPTSREEFTAKTRENIEAQKQGLPAPHNVQWRGPMKEEAPYAPSSTWAGLAGGTIVQPSPVQATGEYAGAPLQEVLRERRKNLRGESVPMAERQQNVRAKRRGMPALQLALQEKMQRGEDLSEQEQALMFGAASPQAMRMGVAAQALGAAIPAILESGQGVTPEAINAIVAPFMTPGSLPMPTDPLEGMIAKLNPFVQGRARSLIENEQWDDLYDLLQEYGGTEEDLANIPLPQWKKALLHPPKRTAPRPRRKPKVTDILPRITTPYSGVRERLRQQGERLRQQG